MTTKNLEEFRGGPIKTEDATLTIQMPNEKLKVGSHIFQLQVVDDSTNPSDPAQVTVIVVDSQKPTAVIAACDEQGNPLVRNRVPFGSGFMLDGRKSVDIGGRIVTYIWTRVEG